jgi:hypothetical protein
VIPVSQITKFQCKQTVTGTPTTKLFTIHSADSATHTFQTYNVWETGVLKTLLVSMIDQLPDTASAPLYKDTDLVDIMSDSVQVSVAQQVSMRQYMQHQAIWKQVIGDMVRDDPQMGPKVATIKLDASGAKVFRGLVIQPPSPVFPELYEEYVKGQDDILEVVDMTEYSRFKKGGGPGMKIGSSYGSLSRSHNRNGRIFSTERSEASHFSVDITEKIDDIEREIEKYNDNKTFY